MIFKTTRIAMLAGAGFIALYAGAPALAQDAGAEVSDGSDIIVTARRSEERLQDVPISITVYNQQQLSNRNIATATDLAAYTPSLAVNQRYGPEKASYAIRGFNQDMLTAPTVGMYFADVVGVRAQGGTTSGNTVGAGSFMDLQNVQVLKGPQGTLFGRNTTGGAVLLVPQKPTGRLEGYAEGTVGSYSTRRVQAVLNVPLADSFKVRVAVDRNKRDGYMKNRSGIGADDYNDLNYFAARLSIVADLTPDLENYTIAHYSNSFSNGYAMRAVACNPNATGFTAITATAACDQIARHNARGDSLLAVDVSNPNPYLHLRQWQVINTTTWQASDTLTVKNIISYGEFRERTSFSLYSDNFRISDPAPDLSALGLPPLTPGTPFQYVVLNPTGRQNNAVESTMTEELQLQGRSADGRLTYVAGGYLEFSRPLGWSEGNTSAFLDCTSPANLQCGNNPIFAGIITHSRGKVSFNNHGIFGQATYKFTDQLALTVGGRYTFDKIVAVNEQTTIKYLPGTLGIGSTVCEDTLHFANPDGSRPKVVTSPAGCNITYRTSSKRPTWLVNLDYKPTNNVMLYAKYARGYRQGGISPNAQGMETWGPEKVDAYEIGAKTSFRGAVSGYFNVAAFYNDFRDQQLTASLIPTSTSGATGRTTVINVGKSRIQGIEVDAAATFFDSLRFDLGYAYLDTKILKLPPFTLPPDSPYASVSPIGAVGVALPFSPKNKLTVTATYTLPLDESIGRIALSATYLHTDKYFADATPNLPSIVGTMPATDLLNLNVNWDHAFGLPVDAAFFATNVTNKIYPVGSSGASMLSAGFASLNIAPPRMYGFRLRWSFGE
jgi:iron complex outermembrane receptor protein